MRLDASLWTSNLFLGICLYRTNQFPAALASLEIADRLAPKHHSGRDDVDFWLGASQIVMRRPLAGVRSLERVIARNPKHADALELAVRTYADLSAKAWNEVAEKNLESAPGYEVHGFALEAEGNREGAMEAFRTSKRLSPKRAGPGLSIGRLLLREGKIREASMVLGQEIALINVRPETYYYAGLAATQMSEYVEAAKYLQTAARWPAHNPEAPLALAQVYMATKEPAKAVTAARQAVALDPSSLAAHEILVATLAAEGLKAELDAEQLRWENRQRK